MLQRIQSIYLLLAAVAAGLLYVLPAAQTAVEAEASYLFSDTRFTLDDDVILLSCFGLAALLWGMGIFLFRNRHLQVRLSTIALLLVVGGSAYGVYLFTQDAAQTSAVVAAGVGLPLLSLLFGWLANRSIRYDDRLVKSADRLR
ncbi:MAG: DUF4293 domain-containing protein [Bacteroidota bacterium]